MDTASSHRELCIVASVIAVAAGLVAVSPLDTSYSVAAQPTPEDVGVELTITKERLDLLFDADHDGALDPGDRVGYLIVYANVGTVEATNVIVVDDYDEALVQVGEISQGGIDDGAQIYWTVPNLAPGGTGQLTYVVTLRTLLPPGSYRIGNVASVSSDESEGVEAAISQEVAVEATPTPRPTSTPSSTPTEVPTPTPGPPEVRTLTVGAELATQSDAFVWIMGALALFLVGGGLIVTGVIATKAELEHSERSKVIRVCLVVTMVVGAVLIMGVFGGIERGAAAGILGTVAGYLLRGIREE